MRGLFLQGWTCSCGIFNGASKEWLTACRSCGSDLDAPVLLSDGTPSFRNPPLVVRDRVVISDPDAELTVTALTLSDAASEGLFIGNRKLSGAK